jgi:selenium metabolism protein YedF
MADAKTVDARDMPCPEPVVRTKKALESIEKGRVVVLVNSPVSCQNVQRFARSQGCDAKVSEKDGVFTIEINKVRQAAEKEEARAVVLMIASDRLGSGDDELGEALITAFVNTLPEAKPKPAKMLFINRGVMLTTEGSTVLDTLLQLEQEGVQIFSCGTCLNHYQLKEKLKVGQVTNMYDTVDTLLTAEKVVRV